MAEINLLNIKPHVVSYDLSGYSVLIYGEPKVGKTTLATSFPQSLLLATERGYKALPGVMVQNIDKWAELRTVVRLLKDAAVKEMYKNIIIDTVDLAWSLCEKYICDSKNKNSINEIPFGQGWTMVTEEFDNLLQQIVKLDYGLILISHAQDKTFKREKGEEFNQITPTLPPRGRLVVERLTDLICYGRTIENGDGEKQRLLFLRGNSRFIAGSRFQFLPEYVELSYENLSKAVLDAIKQEEANSNTKFFTKDKQNYFANGNDSNIVEEFDALQKKFVETITNIKNKFGANEFDSKWSIRITQIIESYLGKGGKVSDMTIYQTEQLSLIISDIENFIK